MSDRASWFRCDPSRLLGALAGMEPDSGYLYTVILMRIYEVGGPISDDDGVLSRRTGLSQKRVAAALAWLVAHGKIERRSDGAIDSDTTHDELAFREKSLIDARKAGKESAKRKQIFRAEKNEQIQQNIATPVERPLNVGATSAQQPSTDTEKEEELSVDSSRRGAPKRSNAVLDCLIAGGLSLETAEGVIAHRKAKKCPATLLAAQELVKGFQSTGDPEDAARVMVARGWQGFKLAWYEDHKAKNNNGQRNGKGSLVDAGIDLIRRIDDAEKRRDAPEARGWPRHEDVVLLPRVGGFRP